MNTSRTCKIYFTNLAELVVVIIIACLISNTVCIDCFFNFHRDQFVNGVVFGFLIVLALIVIEICITCDFSTIWSIIVALLGAVCFFIVCIFLFEFVSYYPTYADRVIYIRLVLAGVLSLLMTILFLLNLYLLMKGDNECNYLCNNC